VGPEDSQGFLSFANNPKDAPIIQFGGPWQITLDGRHRMTIGRASDLILAVGTPGLGNGTTALLSYEGVIPEAAYPRVEITFPVARSDDPPIKVAYDLKGRC